MNKTLFRLHSWMALVAFVPLLVICVTGSILVFKHEIDALLIEDKVRVDSGDRARLSLDTLAASVNSSFPSYEIVGWALFQDKARADLVYTMEHGTDEWTYALINQYTGEPLRPPMGLTHHLTDWLLDLHYTLLLGDWGMLVSSVFSILLCLLGISGLILYRKFWKNFFTLRWNARLMVYFSDLHKLVGTLGAPVLLILGFTGAWWNITHFAHEMEEHAAGAEHYKMAGRLYNDDLSLQGLMEDASRQIDNFETTYISFPWEPGANLIFWGDVHADNPLLSQYASNVTYGAQSGEHLLSYDIREATLGARVVDSYRRLHFGDFAGVWSRVLWCVLGLSPLILSVTGITLWYRRREKRRHARKKRRLARQVVAVPG
ncbi:PepSY-associated TM helix domain-containing protein [Microbulbifer guangxiensis]|uniref:PepSY-associated TM helix domain-containing protein n=1 Tax=Microbulbifer guangxiensis TaxID=2904249 RepID=UPI001F2D54A6|nr:PepSY-associated TM helix domain-containing protein [Microbulbifer guangxiensis]